MDGWLIYGANGYTGQLVAEEAARRGWRPILGGRRASALVPLAERLGLEHRVFGLDTPGDLDAALDGVRLVLHCAGPFSATSRPMLEACMRRGAHYLDITGEVAVFEHVHRRGPEIARHGITAIPGVGFDVVPTDCMAATLADALPSARRLELAFAGVGGGLSHGTAATAVQGLGKGGAARVDGRLVAVPLGWRTRRVRLGDREQEVVSIPWGDLSTAWYSTGIPDLTTYTALPSSTIRWMRRVAPLAPVLGTRPVQKVLRAWVDRRITGPTAEQRTTGRSFVWGRAEDDGGRWVEGNLAGPEGYVFTVRASLAAVERVLAGGVPHGALTPSRAFGKDFAAGIEGVTVEPLRRG